MKKMNKDHVDKKYFLLGLLIASGLAFSQLTYEPKAEPIIERLSDFRESNEGIKEVSCEEGINEDLAQILENDVQKVNCIFGGCNSFF